MCLTRFLLYVAFTRVCPNDVTPARWLGMLTWYNTRVINGDMFLVED